MTNHWIDIQNADVVFIMGANPAENHPVSFRWVMAAKDRGATIISVDPRFTRTSAKSDIYVSIRSGTDIAFLGGMIKYILDNQLYHEEYVIEHTNASYLVNPEYNFEEGIFSGFDPDKGAYDKASWWYQMDASGVQLQDRTLQDPQCVFQLLRQHYARYDPETVSNITGAAPEDLLKVYEAVGSTGKPDRVATILYAMGWTQHTYGTQNIRASTIVQLLLGNIGRAGGGINALRGESNVQGSTDHGLLFGNLGGYLKTPGANDATLAGYIDANAPKCSDPKSANWWQNYGKYAISYLKWFYGENATPDNEFGFHWLPKLGAGMNYSWMALFEAMYNGSIKGFFAWGQNPAVGSTDANKVRTALGRLEWMVAVNLWDTETSSFWQRPGVNPADIQTEVFLLPCAASVEKEGSVTNSGRWAQWRYEAASPPGEAKSDAWMINQLMLRLREMYSADPGPNAEPVLNVAWNYGDDAVNIHQVAREINGWAVQDVLDAEGKVLVPAGGQVKNFTQLTADGATACANWVSGSYNADGNMMERRDNTDTHPAGIGLYSNWAWCWPLNRRILYNRAACNTRGVPFDPARFVIRWNETEKKWEGDVPDGGWPPGERHAFIMRRGGRARIFGPSMADGPFPEHYEPWESPVDNPLHPERSISPALWDLESASRGQIQGYPIIATTFRVSEHWQTGAMTRNLPWLAELQPEMFVEMSPELAAERGIANGERVVVESARGAIRAVAVVTRRLRPFHVMGRVVHEVGLPWHWGYLGLVTGGSANELTPSVGDANTMIPETKAFLCNVRKA